MGQHRKFEDYVSSSLEQIEKHKLVFVKDVAIMIGLSRTQFYDKGLHTNEAIQNALVRNRVVLKTGIRNKWYNSKNSASQIALYKLLADEDERKKLSQSYHDVTSNGEQIEAGSKIDLSSVPTDVLEALMKSQSKNQD